MRRQSNSNLSRRDMLKSTAAVTAAATFASLGSNFAFAQASDKIRVGLVGCGGRGTGAAGDNVLTNENVELVALGDVFQDRINAAKGTLTQSLGAKYQVKDDHCFVGFDAYQKVIASDVDLVILATPPGFRPMHIAAAVDAGKHVFAEKPVAVDAGGVRSVIESAKKFKEKKLAFVAGAQRRHDVGYNEVIKRIHDGAIGELTGGNCYWNQGGLWMHPRKPEWSDMEWQLRNWLYFTWLSGDHICEQHIHQHDVMNWVFGGHPVSAYGMGGRQVRTDPAYGHIFDHFAVEYTYPNGARVLSFCRQIDGTDARVSEFVVGTKGKADPAASIKGETTYRFDRKTEAPNALPSPYQQEHKDLVDSIRKGEPLNEAQQIAESTLTAIMGRMTAYTGKQIEWDQALNSQESLMPAKLEMGEIATPAVATPGKTQLT
ncbi:MAG: Gfo/Idh/MocA family oxidoreductase [Tepidisphaeraceae bacterium]